MNLRGLAAVEGGGVMLLADRRTVGGPFMSRAGWDLVLGNGGSLL